jgi:hypothetical protein
MPALTQPVWVRGQVALTTCPVSYVTALSWSWLEQFYAWKLFENTSCAELPARTVDAFCVLEAELAEEKYRVEQRNRTPD